MEGNFFYGVRSGAVCRCNCSNGGMVLVGNFHPWDRSIAVCGGLVDFFYGLGSGAVCTYCVIKILSIIVIRT